MQSAIFQTSSEPLKTDFDFFRILKATLGHLFKLLSLLEAKPQETAF
jgi:hypothetical protein